MPNQSQRAVLRSGFVGAVLQPLHLSMLLAAALAWLAAPPSAEANFGHRAATSWLPLSPVMDLTVILPNSDEADVYAPVVMPSMRHRFEDAFPVVALLQGALVEKGQYRRFGRLLASQGFIVVVPDHLRLFPRIPVPVRFSEVGVVTAVYEGMLAADADPSSPLNGIVDTETMGLVGHSLGGFVGMYAIAGECDVQICTEPGGTYEPPAPSTAPTWPTSTGRSSIWIGPAPRSP